MRVQGPTSGLAPPVLSGEALSGPDRGQELATPESGAAQGTNPLYSLSQGSAAASGASLPERQDLDEAWQRNTALMEDNQDLEQQLQAGPAPGRTPGPSPQHASPGQASSRRLHTRLLQQRFASRQPAAEVGAGFAARTRLLLDPGGAPVCRLSGSAPPT